MSASGRETTSFGRCINLPIFLTWKESEAITDGRPDGLLRCLDGCKMEQKLLDIVEGPDGKIRRLDG